MADVHVKADEPDEPPASLAVRSSRLVVGGGIAISTIAHLMLGGIILFASPRLFATVPENSMMVDIVTAQEFADASNSGTAHPAVENGASTTDSQPAPPAKSEQTANISPAATPQQSAPLLESMPPPVQRRGSDPRAQEARQADPQQALPDPAQIEKLLNLSMEVANPNLDAPPAESAARLSSNEIAAFKQYLRTCWVAPTGTSSAKPNVVVRVSLGPNGRLRAEPDVISVSSASSVDGPALVHSVKRALAQCQPYNVLPSNKYQEWKLLDLSFSQDGIADVGLPQNHGEARPKG